MTRPELERALKFLFSHPWMVKRLSNSTLALRRRNMDPETRGVVIGQLEILDYLEHRVANDLWPDSNLNLVSPPDAPEAERVAPLPRRVALDTR